MRVCSITFSKDTDRKIRKTVFIYIYGSLIGSKLGPSCLNTKKDVRDLIKALYSSGLWFGTKILPQYSNVNVFLIFLLVSLTFSFTKMANDASHKCIITFYPRFAVTDNFQESKNSNSRKVWKVPKYISETNRISL